MKYLTYSFSIYGKTTLRASLKSLNLVQFSGSLVNQKIEFTSRYLIYPLTNAEFLITGCW